MKKKNKKNTRRILVVDDDVIVLELLNIVLSEEGYDVKIVKNPKDAVGKVKKSDPDLVLLDIMMPDINGSQILQMLKHDKKTKDVPVVIISASHEIRQVAESGGADGYIRKPFDLEKLETMVHSKLEA